MNEDRLSKLKSLRQKKKLGNLTVVTDGEALAESLGTQFDKFKTLMNAGVEVNADSLIEELERVSALHEPIAELKQSIEGINIPELPDSVKIDGLESLLKAVQALAVRKEVTVTPTDITPVTKALEALGKQIDTLKVPTPSQTPDNFVPMRRVMLVGKTLMYDDSFYTGGGGGGGSQAAPTILFQPIAQGGAGTTAIAGGVAGKRIKVTSYVVVGGGTGTFKFQGDSNDLTGAMPFVANSGVATSGTEFSALFQTGAGETLNLTTTGAAGQGHISYYFE